MLTARFSLSLNEKSCHSLVSFSLSEMCDGTCILNYYLEGIFIRPDFFIGHRICLGVA